MSSRKCAECGADPAEGFASVYQDGKERWYCHPDDGPSCYAGADASVHGTWADTVRVIKAMPIEQLRAEIHDRQVKPAAMSEPQRRNGE